MRKAKEEQVEVYSMDDEVVAAGQRLYMTTTPKVYRDYRRAQSEGGTGRGLLHGR